MAAIREHYNVLIVCALEKELKQAKRVLENGTGSNFVNKYPDLDHLNMRVCEGWNSTPLKVAMCSQVKMGGIESQKLVSELARHFTADVVVMTGICAGDENKYGNVEHGSVVIAKRTTTVESGKVTEKDEFLTFAQYSELEKRIDVAVAELVEAGKSTDKSAEWVKYVPADAGSPSPRLVREVILDYVYKDRNIMKRTLLEKMEGEKQLDGMTTMNVGNVLEIMQEQKDPWIRVEGKFDDEFVVTDTGERYLRNQSGFRRNDVIIAHLDSMATIPNVTENLKKDMQVLKKHAADRKLKAVDMESHMFMEQVKESFRVDGRPGVGVVMKGISDYGSRESKVDYYQDFAACTSAAFLMHLLKEKQFLFIKITGHTPTPGDRAPEASPGTSAMQEPAQRKKLNELIDAVLDNGCDKWYQIGGKLGLKDGVITGSTAQISDQRDKLEHLIKLKQRDVGGKELEQLLLLVCNQVHILGAVKDQLGM